MNEQNTNDLAKSINMSRESLKNSLEITLESYIEVFSKLELMSYLITNKENNV